MEQERKFKVGEKVFIERELESWESFYSLYPSGVMIAVPLVSFPYCCRIQEILTQECMGGIQTFYCIGYCYNGQWVLCKFPEWELISKEEGEKRLVNVVSKKR
jgi:hypothetical protein